MANFRQHCGEAPQLAREARALPRDVARHHTRVIAPIKIR